MKTMTTEEAKDLAAQEFAHGDFQQLLGYLISGGDILKFQEVEDRAMQIYAYSQAKESFNAGVELVNQDWHNQEFCVGKTCLCNGIKLKYTNFDEWLFQKIGKILP